MKKKTYVLYVCFAIYKFVFISFCIESVGWWCHDDARECLHFIGWETDVRRVYIYIYAGCGGHFVRTDNDNKFHLINHMGWDDSGWRLMYIATTRCEAPHNKVQMTKSAPTQNNDISANRFNRFDTGFYFISQLISLCWWFFLLSFLSLYIISKVLKYKQPIYIFYSKYHLIFNICFCKENNVHVTFTLKWLAVAVAFVVVVDGASTF